MKLTEEQEKALKKIKKIIKLAENNPNKEEAASAKQKAFQMLTDYDIDISALNNQEPEPQPQQKTNDYSTEQNNASYKNYNYSVHGMLWSAFKGLLELLWDFLELLFLMALTPTIFSLMTYTIFIWIFNINWSWTVFGFYTITCFCIANIAVIVPIGFCILFFYALWQIIMR